MAGKKTWGKQKAPEFCMEEDFPTLPTTRGVTTPTNSYTSDGGSGAGADASDRHSLPSCDAAAATNSSTSSNTDKPNSTDHLTAPSNTTSCVAGDPSKSVQLLHNDHITGIPDEMVQNQFGMLGLLKLTQIDPTFGVFAPGIDLSKQNLANLALPGEMHSGIESSQADQRTLPPHETECDVPVEYRIHHRIAGRLPPDPPLDKLADETLFWIFYNLCREEAQLVAAKELYNRNLRYHRKKMRWFTRVPGSDVIREGSMEKGTYYCWDPQHLRKSVQRLTISYADLDDIPTTYRLSSPTLNARVQYISSNPHQQ